MSRCYDALRNGAPSVASEVFGARTPNQHGPETLSLWPESGTTHAERDRRDSLTAVAAKRFERLVSTDACRSTEGELVRMVQRLFMPAATDGPGLVAFVKVALTGESAAICGAMAETLAGVVDESVCLVKGMSAWDVLTAFEGGATAKDTARRANGSNLWILQSATPDAEETTVPVRHWELALRELRRELSTY